MSGKQRRPTKRSLLQGLLVLQFVYIFTHTLMKLIERSFIMVVKIKLDKHQAKVLRRLLKSDREEFAESIVELANLIGEGQTENDIDDPIYEGTPFKKLMYHTTDAIQVLDVVINQL